MKRLCTICARGGSRGVVNKNLRPLLGRPLLAHSVTLAVESGLFEAVAVSSDSQEILAAARQWGADLTIRRPAELATDQAAKLPAIAHCVREVEKRLKRRFDVVTDLDATSPLRNLDDLRGAVRLLEEQGRSNVITGAQARRSPYFNLVERDGQGFVRLCKPLPSAVVRRQDAPACFDMNASIYVWWRDLLLERPAVFYSDTLLYEMPAERSQDIDSELDFSLVEFLLTKRTGV